MARRMLHNNGHVRRWSDTDDVLQASLLRLHRALATVQPESVRKLYGLAAVQIRRELIDLARSHYGPMGIGSNHETDGELAVRRHPDSSEPETLADWTRFHEAVDCLPQNNLEAFSLTWYDGLTQAEAARVVGCSLATLKRRLVSAKLQLEQVLRRSDYE